MFRDDFDGPGLDRSVWLPHYLPAWSSQAETAARYDVEDSCLHLWVEPDQPLWCAPDHAPLRVSGVQSGNWSGPVGSTRGQQPYREGVTVREAQEPFGGWTPQQQYVEVRARGEVGPGSMFAFWLVGLEDHPERSAEICVAEVFGKDVVPGESAAVGMGLHPFRDPAVVEDFAAPRLLLDVTRWHTYAADWQADRVDLLVDGTVVRSCPAPPSYPMQLMVAVFAFPDEPSGPGVPQVFVDHVAGGPSGPGPDGATTRRN